ncbi:MAG: hypothetical protein M3Y37_00675 [Chloroflexota bacterium]|nr:hypothetical protein [Chloroflexota bacterium]
MDTPQTDQIDEPIEFTAEDQLELLRSNTLAMALATVSFLRKQGIDARDWAAELGSVFARGWDTDEPWSPEEFLDATIVNLTTFGGEARQAEFSDDEATARIHAFPDRARVEGLGLEDVDGDILFELIGPIATACGLRWSWQREEDSVLVRVVPAGDLP